MPTEEITPPEEIHINKHEEIQQILGVPPTWITQWGIPLLVTLLIIILSLSWFIHYPQIISAPVTLTQESEIVGKLRLPAVSAARVKPQQKVKIYLNNFPYQDFGTLNGHTQHIYSVSNRETFEVTIKLEQAMRSSGGQEIPFTTQMPGTAEIIVEDKRISDYLLDQITQNFR